MGLAAHAIGWLVVLFCTARGLLFGVRAVKRRRRSQQQFLARRADFCRRVEATAQVARATRAIADWEGWRPFRVAAIVDEARDVRSFYFSPVDGRPLSPFAPGQFLTFRLQIDGSDAPLVRCYSLSDRPHEDYYRTTIKRVLAPTDQPDLPPGRGSGYFHDNVRVGDVLHVRAPAGTFFIDPADTRPLALIGAGIGITPLVSMLDAVIHAGRRREVYVLVGFHNSREQPFKEYLQRLTEEHPYVRLHVSYSAPLAEDVLYRDYNHRGRMTIERVREILPSNNFRFYVCGPGQMMESLVPALWAWGVPEEHVYYEAFGPASVRRLGAERASTAQCEVRFERSGRAATWDGTLASLLEFGEAAGIALPSGCRAGSCGECLLAIRRGTFATLKSPSVPVPPGHCLTCISVPTSELVLDA
jgi:uncharacterized protein